jgi:hypothetical protein
MIYIAMAKDTLNFGDDSCNTSPKNIAPIIHCHRNLFVARKCFEKIDRMILLNFEDQTIKKEDIDQFLKSQFFQIRPNRIDMNISCDNEEDADLISHMKVFNKEDLVIVNVHEVETQLMQGVNNINLKQLKKNINKDSVFSYFLHSEKSILFLKILSELENVTIYRRSYRKERIAGQRLIPETNVKEYFRFQKNLSQPLMMKEGNIKIPSSFLECLPLRGRVSNFYRNISSLLSGSIKKAILIGSDGYSDDFIANHILIELEKFYRCKFSDQDAAGGNAEVDISKNRLFIRNADEMNVGVKNKIMIIANSEDQTDKIIILQSKKPIDSINDTSFIPLLLPSKEQIASIYSPVFLFIISNEFLIHFPQRELNQEEIRNLHKPAVTVIFWKIPTLLKFKEEVRDLIFKINFRKFNFSDSDFLWEFKNYIDEQYPTDKAKEQEQEKALEEKKVLVKVKRPKKVKEPDKGKKPEQSKNNNSPQIQPAIPEGEKQSEKFKENIKSDNPLPQMNSNTINFTSTAWVIKYYGKDYIFPDMQPVRDIIYIIYKKINTNDVKEISKHWNRIRGKNDNNDNYNAFDSFYKNYQRFQIEILVQEKSKKISGKFLLSDFFKHYLEMLPGQRLISYKPPFDFDFEFEDNLPKSFSIDL